MATNISLWIHIVIKESILEINHAQHSEDSSNSTHGVYSDSDDYPPSCDGYTSDILGDGTLSVVNPFIFPFAIEFALTGAIFFFHMSKTLDRL